MWIPVVAPNPEREGGVQGPRGSPGRPSVRSVPTNIRYFPILARGG